jgi:hypothetical protein
LDEIYAMTAREWLMTVDVPPTVTKRDWLEETLCSELKRAHHSHEKSLKIAPFSGSTLCKWYGEQKTSAGKQRAARSIAKVRSSLQATFADGLCLLPTTVERSLLLRPSESLLDYISRINNQRIPSEHRLRNPSTAERKAPVAVAEPTGSASACMASHVRSFYAEGSLKKRSSTFASGIASFATFVSSIDGTTPTLRAAAHLLAPPQIRSETAAAVTAPTTTRKFHTVEDYHSMVVTHRLLQNVPLVYGCDSKIIKGKNFESQYIWETMLPEKRKRSADAAHERLASSRDNPYDLAVPQMTEQQRSSYNKSLGFNVHYTEEQREKRQQPPAPTSEAELEATQELCAHHFATLSEPPEPELAPDGRPKKRRRKAKPLNGKDAKED